MSIEDGTEIFTLTRDLPFKHDGASVDTREILLKEPCIDHAPVYMRLRQMIMRAQMELASQADVIKGARDNIIGEELKPIDEAAKEFEESVDARAEFVSMAILSSSSVDAGKFIELFEKMACHNGARSICLVDGRVAMTRAIWSNLKPDDAFNMAVRWCCFFGMPSEGGERTTLKQPSSSHMERTEA